MKCPNCDVSFHPQMRNHIIGQNANGFNVFAYFQMCAECKQPILGVKETKSYYPLDSDVEGLTLLIKKS
jgi:hypothetical protein